LASSARHSASCRRLLDLVQQGATGRLSVGAGSAELSLFLLDGNVIAARAIDDTVVLIERLAAAGAMSQARARQLFAMQHMSSTVLGEAVVDPILGVLFEECADDTLDELLQARFEENVARYVGHRGQPRHEADEVPWAYNVRMGHDSVALVEQASEVWDLAAGIPEDRVVSAGPRAPRDGSGSPVVEALQGGALEVRELVERLGLPSLVGRATIARALAEGLLQDGEPDSAPTSEPVEEPTVEWVAVQPAVEEIEALVEVDLDAFSGADDRNRGGTRGGTFVAEREKLDRVELVDLEGVTSSPTYSAPTLTEEEAKAKVQVANDVLVVVAGAYDRHRGAQQGSTTIQLLVDGRPRSYIPLFDGVRVRQRGDLPFPELLANLRRRPETEQRHLLNQGMLDLLDRALDKAADELPEDDFDEVLGQVMGYRQRLVL
jgi:hypothetical protein